MRTLVMMFLVAVTSLCYYPSVPVVAVRASQPESSVPITMPDAADLYLNLAALEAVTDDGGMKLISYPIAIGNVYTPTPRGEMYLVNRIYLPVWWPKNKSPVPPGDHNPLGLWWLGLDRPGYGIHGTNNPQSIGTLASLGCVRMFNEHVSDVADRLHVGARVVIGSQEIELRQETVTGRLWLYVWQDPYSPPVEVCEHAVQAVLQAGGLSCSETTAADVRDSVISSPPVVGQPAVFALYAPGMVRTTIVDTAWVTDKDILIPLRMAAAALDLGVQYDPVLKLAVVNDRSVQGPIIDRTMFIPFDTFGELVNNKGTITAHGWLVR